MHVHAVGVSLVCVALLALRGDWGTPIQTERAGSPTATTTSTAAADTDTVRQELIRLERDSWRAWKARDSAYFNRFLAQDHIEIGQGGVTHKKAVVAFVGSPMCVVSAYSFDKFAFTMFNDRTALLTYRAEQKTVCGGQSVPSPAWVSSLYVLRDGHWVNAAYQQTPIAAH